VGSSDGTFEAYRDGVIALAAALVDHRNAFFDLGNERTVGDARYLDDDQVAEIAAGVLGADPGRLLTASTGGMPPADAAGVYAELYGEASIHFATPHFERTDDWAAATGDRVTEMRDALVGAGWDRPIYLQEEARRAYDGAQWPKEDFLAAAAAAESAGAAGWCFHTQAGFDLSQGAFLDQLDDVEADTLDELAAAIGR
jgi:hypothetical protein